MCVDPWDMLNNFSFQGDYANVLFGQPQLPHLLLYRVHRAGSQLKTLTFSTLQRLLSLDMKTKVVQHVPRIKPDTFEQT